MCFLLIVCYEWQEEDLEDIELYFHGFIWPLGIGMAGYGLIYDVFQYDREICWVSADVPKVYEEDMAHSHCLNPQLSHVQLLENVIALIILIHSCFTIYSIDSIYRKSASLPLEIRRGLARKGMLYALVIAIGSVPSLVASGWVAATGRDTPVTDALFSTMTLWLSLVGFVDMLIFLWRREEMKSKYGSRVVTILESAGINVSGRERESPIEQELPKTNDQHSWSS